MSVNAVSAQGQVAARVTSPRMALGFDLGDDYQLANYTQLSAYWHKLDQESDRLSVVEYGKTSEGRPMLISSVAGICALTGQRRHPCPPAVAKANREPSMHVCLLPELVERRRPQHGASTTNRILSEISGAARRRPTSGSCRRTRGDHRQSLPVQPQTWQTIIPADLANRAILDIAPEQCVERPSVQHLQDGQKRYRQGTGDTGRSMKKVTGLQAYWRATTCRLAGRVPLSTTRRFVGRPGAIRAATSFLHHSRIS